MGYRLEFRWLPFLASFNPNVGATPSQRKRYAQRHKS
jgi:hypothetical protein